MSTTFDYLRSVGKKLVYLLPLSLVLAGAQVALAAPSNKSVADITVVFNDTCTEAEITSSKDLSNIVIDFVGDDNFQKLEAGEDFDEEEEGVTELTLEADGETFEIIYVKSGSSKQKVPGLPGYVGDEFVCTVDGG